MTMDEPMVAAYFVCVATIAGLCMGSFLNCLAWRMTHGESVLHGRSHCTTCGHVLGVRDLVPVLSWLTSGGKCRYCGERVSVRYPATEVLCAVVYVSLLLRYGLTLETVELLAFASVLLVLSLTDIDEYIIPNKTIIAAIVIRVAYIAAVAITGMGDAANLALTSVVGGLAVGLPLLGLIILMDHVLGRDSMGGGDLKLFFVAGLYFGWQQCLFLVVVACVLGIVFGALGQRVGGGGQDDEEGPRSKLIPFGPAIAASCWITMLVGAPVLDWYLTLFQL